LSPAKRVVLSNAPPYFKNEIIERILSRYGKQTATIRPILDGIKKFKLAHVERFRMQTFMILSEQHQDLDMAIKLVQGGWEGLCDIHFLKHHQTFCMWRTQEFQ
jgi:hypothetical protein